MGFTFRVCPRGGQVNQCGPSKKFNNHPSVHGHRRSRNLEAVLSTMGCLVLEECPRAILSTMGCLLFVEDP